MNTGVEDGTTMDKCKAKFEANKSYIMNLMIIIKKLADSKK